MEGGSRAEEDDEDDRSSHAGVVPVEHEAGRLAVIASEVHVEGFAVDV